MTEFEQEILNKIKELKDEKKDGFYVTVNLPTTQPQTAANFGIFFIARHPCEIMRVSEVHGTVGGDAGAVTMDLEILTGTTAKGSGTTALASTFNLKSTANTVVTKEGTGLAAARQLKEGDRLALKTSGTLTALADVQVTLYLKFLGRGSYK